jgi:diadenosine tetraphosphate (Ap4A) HIT family hydrolase
MNCPFCDPNHHKTRIVFEGTYSRVILSNPCLMRGHLLVIPKRHVEKLSQLDSDEKKEMFDLIEKYQELILKKISSGCDIRQHHRPFQEENKYKVNHLHFHLQPRDLYDELYRKCQVHETEVFQDLPQEEIEDILGRLS